MARKRTDDLVSLEDQATERFSEQILDNLLSDPQRNFDNLKLYMAPFWQYPVIRNPLDWEALFHQYRNGNQQEARDLLVYHNIKLVLSIALRYSGKGLPLLDMIQEGVIGLMKAIEEFDPTRGHAFSTYATWWIRQAITRAISNTGGRYAYRLPVHLAEKVSMVRRALSDFFKTCGRWPSNVLELREQVQVYASDVARTMTLREVKQCHRLILYGVSASLDEPIGHDGGERQATRGDFIEDRRFNTETIVEARRLVLEYNRAIERIEAALKLMPARTAMVLRLRCGLDEFEPMTLEQVGERYELTRERARQLEVSAFRELRGMGITITSPELQELLRVRDDLLHIAESV